MSDKEKGDLSAVFANTAINGNRLTMYWAGFGRLARYGRFSLIRSAFVATNSICQGQQVPAFWSAVLVDGLRINFARTRFIGRTLRKITPPSLVVVGLAGSASSARLYVEGPR
ncbi:MAG: DNA methyltransferase [Burkholderiales bacterium]